MIDPLLRFGSAFIQSFVHPFITTRRIVGLQHSTEHCSTNATHDHTENTMK